MKVSTRLAGGFGLLVLLVLGLVAFNVSSLFEMVETSRQLNRVSSGLHLGTSELQARLLQMDEFARKYAATGDTAYARRFGDYADAFGASLDELEALAPDAGEPVRRQVRHLRALWDDFQPVVEEFRDMPPADPVAVSEAAAPVVRWVDALRAQGLQVSEDLRRSMRASVATSAERARWTERVSWFAAGAGVLLALGVAIGIVRSIAGGLGRLTEGTRRLAEGDLEHRLDTNGAPEFAQLADSFNRMTRRLQEVDRMKRDFFAHVSHDLNTPLSAMLDAHELLLDEIPGPLGEDQERLLRLSRESGRRLREMIGRLLALARLDAGTADLDRTEVDLKALVRRTVRAQEPRLRKTGVECAIEAPEEPLTIEADESYLTRVVENLVANAVDFSPEGGRIGVGLRLLEAPPPGAPEGTGSSAASGSDGWVELEVVDQGPGVEEERRELVFEPFVRGEGRQETPTGGLGLGLALCREVAQAHEGTVWVEEADGGGSRFCVLLPRRMPA